jgi:hypothetical protein
LLGEANHDDIEDFKQRQDKSQEIGRVLLVRAELNEILVLNGEQNHTVDEDRHHRTKGLSPFAEYEDCPGDKRAEKKCECTSRIEVRKEFGERFQWRLSRRQALS